MRPGMAKGPSVAPLTAGGGTFPPTSPVIVPAWFLLGTLVYTDFTTPGASTKLFYATAAKTMLHGFFTRVTTGFTGVGSADSSLMLGYGSFTALTGIMNVLAAAEYPVSLFEGGYGNVFTNLSANLTADVALTAGSAEVYGLLSLLP